MIARALSTGMVFLQGLVPTTSESQIYDGRSTVESLEFESIRFEQPEITEHRVLGVDVLMLEDHQLPIASVYAYFRGGYGLFERAFFASSRGLPAILRYGGTTERSPRSIDESLEYHAIQTTFGSAGSSMTATVNTLTEHLDTALEVWNDMLVNPRFDTAEVAAWAGRQLEAVRRRADDPSRFAFSEFNQLLYGEHPIGWEMNSADLAPEFITAQRFQVIHQRVVCRDNLILGVTGDTTWDTIAPLITDLVADIPPCSSELPDPPVPHILRKPGVFLIEKDLEQAIIVMAHPTTVQLADEPDYYSALIGNSILGGGGFSSRILNRVRTEHGYAYSATSLWTTPREHEGILGAVTRTRPENTVPAIDVILQTMAELRAAPPTPNEVKTTVDQVVNGFVFNFDTPGQIVSRHMLYRAHDLPDDWLDRYLRGVRGVSPESVRTVFAQHLSPDAMTILVVGNPDRIGRTALEALGPVTILEVRE